jgi:hypothetical protein
MPLLDAIPVNVFIIGTSILAGVILFMILWMVPDEDEETEEKLENKSVRGPEVKETVEVKQKSKRKKLK